jgi:hypothetical protein
MGFVPSTVKPVSQTDSQPEGKGIGTQGNGGIVIRHAPKIGIWSIGTMSNCVIIGIPSIVIGLGNDIKGIGTVPCEHETNVPAHTNFAFICHDFVIKFESQEVTNLNSMDYPI